MSYEYEIFILKYFQMEIFNQFEVNNEILKNICFKIVVTLLK